MIKLIDKFVNFVTANKAVTVFTVIWIFFVWGTVENVLMGADTVRTLAIVVLAGPTTLVLVLGRNYVFDYLVQQNEERYLKKQQGLEDRPSLPPN